MSDPSKLIHGFEGKKIAVIGDLVIDEYVFATPLRISREAPVVIVGEESRQVRLGSAGNVVANIRSLGGRPAPVGLVGDDAMGRTVVDMMQKKDINPEGILVDASRPTATKTRILAGDANTVRQQMLRIDRLSQMPVEVKVQKRLTQLLMHSLEDAQALVVSDYGEGVVAGQVFEAISEIVRKDRIPVFVDSRFRIAFYRNACALVPNEPELRAATKLKVDTDEELENAGRWLLDHTGAEVVLVKRGCRGMALFEREKPTVKIAAYGSDEVADRIGAGDTVLAAYALARTTDMSPVLAARVANTAGGITVTKSGTSAVGAAELAAALERGG